MNADQLLTETFADHERLAPDPDLVLADIRRQIQSPRRPRVSKALVAGAAALIVVVVAAAATLLTHATTTPTPAVATQNTLPSPEQGVHGPFLLNYVPAAIGPVRLATGTTAGVPWELWAEMTAVTGIPTSNVVVHDNMPLAFVSGLGLSTVIGLGHHAGGGSGPSGDPRRMARMSLSSFGPGSTFDSKLILGVTSVPATTIRIRKTGRPNPVVVKVVTNAKLPGLYFFVAQVPTGHISAIDALDANGSVLLQADPTQIPQGP